MFKQLFTRSLIIILALTVSFSVAQARELNMAQLQKTMQENSPITTEDNAVNIALVFTELMAYLSTDLTAPMATDIKTILPQVNSLLQKTNANSDAQLVELVNVMKNEVATIVQGLNQNNSAIKNMGQQVLSLKNVNAKFPTAKFLATLELLIGLTQEFVANHENLTIELNRYVLQIDEIQKLIEAGSAESAKGIKQLAETALSIEKHSFTEIGSRYDSIGAVLKMMYQK